MYEQIAETQISLDFDTVWSAPLLSARTNVPADLSLFGLQAILLACAKIYYLFISFLNDNS